MLFAFYSVKFSFGTFNKFVFVVSPSMLVRVHIVKCIFDIFSSLISHKSPNNTFFTIYICATLSGMCLVLIFKRGRTKGNCCTTAKLKMTHTILYVVYSTNLLATNNIKLHRAAAAAKKREQCDKYFVDKF